MFIEADVRVGRPPSGGQCSYGKAGSGRSRIFYEYHEPKAEPVCINIHDPPD
jgi:hypothetical protein